jgi:nucleotide-binding universal stress UspA family protein
MLCLTTIEFDLGFKIIVGAGNLKLVKVLSCLGKTGVADHLGFNITLTFLVWEQAAGATMSFQKILVAVDHSDLCQSMFGRALELAQACQSQIFLLHCLRSEMGIDSALSPISLGMSDLGAYPRVLDNSVWEVQTQRKQAIALLQNYSQTATGLGIAVEFDYKIGEPGHCICQVAEDWQADLIIVGRRGLKGLTEAVLGSISNHVVHHAPCAVLVIQ